MEIKMKYFTIVFILVIQVWFVSCDRSQKSENNDQNLSTENRLETPGDYENIYVQNTENQNQNQSTESRIEETNYFVSEQEMEKIRIIVQTYRPNGHIVHLARVDFGVPGGENWLVRFRYPGPEGNSFYYSIGLCVINGENVSRYYSVRPDDLDLEGYTEYDIMKDIPGTRMGSNAASAYDDYNGDGIVEVFQYFYGGMGNFIFILGYDQDTDQIINYCGVRSPDISFDIIDPQNGPAPVEFMTYNGKYGFKVYFAANSVWPDPPNPYNYKWFFYVWDEEQREYVNMGEVLER
jgi:hypothetical protein